MEIPKYLVPDLRKEFARYSETETEQKRGHHLERQTLMVSLTQMESLMAHWKPMEDLMEMEKELN